jgi:hypothetical protein
MDKKNKFNDYFEFIIKLLFTFFTLYWFLYFITPKTKMVDEDKNKIELLNKKIDTLINKQKEIDSIMVISELNIDSINTAISKIKIQKTIIKEYYYEKVNNISEFNDAEIDSFFANRYGLYPSKNFPNTNSKVNN